ncbi:hypothetical protein GCM10008101_06820 [Lysobacter xinjiangensis]|uniref:Uncharacterized protein n=1 Tax=Cognatilysobacter xinjiangensis TaxID=546892 RepID=A0ABQ3BVL5_9GAMM|nr:hypothetical protein [Lysobacter xinjiangensis]GGZ56049.1 hypothetical protein GCM10008101_06820 [Lysobacter xinjiangensis]
MSEHPEARAFVTAAGALCETLVQELTRQHPEMAQGVCQALENGHRMLIAMECDAAGTRVGLCTVDDYQKLRWVIAVPSKPPSGSVSSLAH